MADYPIAHAVPDGDLIEHDTINICPCGPLPHLVEREDGTKILIYVHPTLDGREVDILT